jgi:hypothetical protein
MLPCVWDPRSSYPPLGISKLQAAVTTALVEYAAFPNHALVLLILLCIQLLLELLLVHNSRYLLRRPRYYSAWLGGVMSSAWVYCLLPLVWHRCNVTEIYNKQYHTSGTRARFAMQL